jgi:hypothetical protein
MADQILPTAYDFHGKCRDLLHAANLRHGTGGFTSLPKGDFFRPKNSKASAGFEPANDRRLYFPSEGGFLRPKNPTASAGFEPANLGTRGQHANH